MLLRKPAWLRSFLDGDVFVLDAHLSLYGLDLDHLKGLPYPSCITQSPASVGVSAPSRSFAKEDFVQASATT